MGFTMIFLCMYVILVIFKVLFLFLVYECFTFMYVCASHIHRAHGGKKRVFSPLELELWTTGNCYVGAGN